MGLVECSEKVQVVEGRAVRTSEWWGLVTVKSSTEEGGSWSGQQGAEGREGGRRERGGREWEMWEGGG